MQFRENNEKYEVIYLMRKHGFKDAAQALAGNRKIMPWDEDIKTALFYWRRFDKTQQPVN